MPEYLFADGPLEGQLIGTRDLHVVGDLMTVELVDVELAPELLDSPWLHDYRVESVAAAATPGLLRHVPAPRSERLAG